VNKKVEEKKGYDWRKWLNFRADALNEAEEDDTGIVLRDKLGKINKAMITRISGAKIKKIITYTTWDSEVVEFIFDSGYTVMIDAAAVGSDDAHVSLDVTIGKTTHK